MAKSENYLKSVSYGDLHLVSRCAQRLFMTFLFGKLLMVSLLLGDTNDFTQVLTQVFTQVTSPLGRTVVVLNAT